jgi:hypothetical protein
MFAELLAMIAAYTIFAVEFSCKRRVETLRCRAMEKDKEQAEKVAEGKIRW